MNSFSRLVTALLLATSLLAGSVASFGQTSTSAPPAQKPSETAHSTPAKKDNSPAVPTKTADATKPLSVNEDPAMIGKRNINKGIIAKMSGSTESEVKQGRELAAEVDRQAKFVDDPVITEYVNRVGQNIVLHSDAKIPFTIKVIDSDEVNAFALPGGFFYVNKGLILVADNEAEVAGVMGYMEQTSMPAAITPKAMAWLPFMTTSDGFGVAVCTGIEKRRSRLSRPQ